MRAVQWPIPGILKVPATVEELERGVRAGTRSKRSPTPFRNWTANADRGWTGRRGHVEEIKDTVPALLPSLQHTSTHLSVIALGPVRSSGVEAIQLGQDQSQMFPQGVAVSPHFHLFSGPLLLFAEDQGHLNTDKLGALF